MKTDDEDRDKLLPIQRSFDFQLISTFRIKSVEYDGNRLMRIKAIVVVVAAVVIVVVVVVVAVDESNNKTRNCLKSS